MFSGIRRAFGSVVVKEKATEIVVEGIPADVMVRDISRIWKTSKITMNMFNTLGRNMFSFNSFFAADLVYMIDVMLQSRKAYTSARVLRNIQQEIIANTWLRNTIPGSGVPERLDFSQLNNLKDKPLDHQMDYLKQYSQVVNMYGLDGYLMAAAPGAGKTLGSLQVAECLHADLTVVVCPKAAVEKPWEETVLQKAFKSTKTCWVYASGKPYNGEQIAVVHYEGLQPVLDLVNAGRMKGRKVCVILDESHNLNEITALRTQLFLALCKALKSQDVVFASGTAIKALGAEMIPLLRCIDPLFTPDTEARFKKIFGRDATKALDIISHRLGLVSFKVEKKTLKLDPPIFKSKGIRIPNGAQFTLPEIRKLMEAFITERVKYYKDRRPKDEAFWAKCLDLHKATLKSKEDRARFEEYQRVLKIVIKVQDPRYCGDEIKATNLYEKKYFDPSLPQVMRKEFRDVKSVIKYTSLKIQGECLGRVLGRTRIECTVAMTAYVDFVDICESTEKKTIVFTSFVEALHATEQRCLASGLKPILVYGATNNVLSSTVTKFEKDKAINPLGATYQSLGTAVPLVMADTMILLNAPFRSYILDQAVSRIHRLGQDSQTVVWQMYLDTGEIPNISTRSNEILKWSQEQVAAIMGIESPFVLEEVSGMEGFDETQGFDDNALIHGVLQSGFEAFDIEIGLEDFTPVNVKPQRPAYLSW